MNSTQNLETIKLECQQFPALFQSVHLATCSAKGEPEASYAAYVEYEGSYFIYISELAAHTANLRANECCSAMFIESEDAAAHLLARRRLTLQCRAREWARGTADFDAVLDLFETKFGKFMSMLRGLEDFHLYQLSPIHASYVSGFAKAYRFEGEGLTKIKHRSEQGHRKVKNESAAA